MDYFRKKDFGNGIIRIETPFDVYMYLVIGKEKAALIDTGYGVGDLKTYICSITELPLVVLCSHGHVDHASGSAQFGEVYLNQKDWELEREHTRPEKRIEIAEALSGICPREEDLIPQRGKPYLDLEDGKVFNLGGLTVEAVSCPGHTQGCMCFLIKELHMLILGDACNSNTFLFFPEASKVQNYLENLKRLNGRTDEFEHAIFFHPDNYGDKNNIEENIMVCQEILHGTDDHIACEVLGNAVFSAKKTNDMKHRIDGKSANILYVLEKLGSVSS